MAGAAAVGGLAGGEVRRWPEEAGGSRGAFVSACV